MRGIIIHIAAFPAIMTALLYGVLARWWRTDTGRHVFILQVVLAMLLGHQLVTFWLGMDYPGRQIVINVLYFLGALALWWRFISFVRLQIIERHNSHERSRT